MKNRRVGFAILGASLLGLAGLLAVRRDPRDDGPPQEPTHVPEGAGVLTSGAGPTLATQGAVLDAFDTPLAGNSSVAGEVLHDDPDVLHATSLWLVGPIRGPAHGESPRVPLPIVGGGFARSGLAPGEYAIEGECKERSLRRSFLILANGEEKTLSIDLTTVLPRKLRGRAFLDSKKNPLSNERLALQLVTWQSMFQAAATTEPDGSFEIVLESNSWNIARFFRNAPSAPFVEIQNTASSEPLEVIFASGTGRKGFLTTRRKEPLPFTEFMLRSSDRPTLRYFKTSDDQGRFPTDDVMPGEYEASARTGSEEPFTTTVTVPEEGSITVALPFDDFVVIEALDAGPRTVNRGYLYHVHLRPTDTHIWNNRPWSTIYQGVSGSPLAAIEEGSSRDGPPSGAVVLGLPPAGECAVEVLSLEHGWGRATFALPLPARVVQVSMKTPVEIEIAVTDANGNAVENPVFKFPGFYENAPLLPGSGQRYFDSTWENIGFDLKAGEEPGKFRVRLAPGSTVSVEAPGRGKVQCEADRILKERAVVLE